MQASLQEIYDALSPGPPATAGKPAYSVAAIPGKSGFFVGRDRESLACILIELERKSDRPRAPIRLESIDVLFSLECLVKQAASTSEGAFTVIRCRSSQATVIRYFLSVGEGLIGLLGERPSDAAIATAVNRLVQIFRKLEQPSSRALSGLLGELLLISESADVPRMLEAWRAVDTSRFDFSAGDVRIEAKATTGRLRSHVFSYEQCSPPPGTLALAASLFIEQASSGRALRELVARVEREIAANSDLLLKLHEIIAETLGTGLSEAMTFRFDERLAISSLQLFDLRSIPAIRGALPVGVTDLHFRVDLSASVPISKEELIARHPESTSFLQQLP